jgi:hypothetical protein
MNTIIIALVLLVVYGLWRWEKRKVSEPVEGEPPTLLQDVGNSLVDIFSSSIAPSAADVLHLYDKTMRTVNEIREQSGLPPLDGHGRPIVPPTKEDNVNDTK